MVAQTGVRFLVTVLIVLSWWATPAGAVAPHEEGVVFANAYWSTVDDTGCISTDIGVATSTNGQAFLNVNRYRAHTPGSDQCPEPGLSLVSAYGTTSSFSFEVSSPSLKSGTLDATILLTCSGPDCPSSTVEASVNLTWTGKGGVLKAFDDDGNRYRYRYFSATGEVAVGGVNLVAGLGPSDPTETNLVLQIPAS